PAMPQVSAVGEVLAEVTGIGVELGGRFVIEDVDVQVAAGELVALVGPNGAGKSTLLHALTGDLTPSRGRVAVGGRSVVDWTDRELALRRAVLPQQVAVSFPFTVAEVVRMGRAAWAGTDAEAADDEQVA